ncbi:sugar O-acetyltransferase [Intestinimonas butyriciproducens]|uniref:Sugar O-acetyltransferase n=1 Tax=Candidatus Intestinimonas merdavium TaxID=2838622 RepID=A0A9D1Z5F5_9FIRM|nr:sugar O-acetyltransferase [Intestinimonas butyriciproducens]MBM6976139.1 sugar O-acetyltransferase [Intestinimonas butyriciproducens]HIY73762.1 sugar O-acetyltransferase [Candidatus Intestinimonas merdavium]
MTEQEKMAAGLWYDANFDPELLAARTKAEELCAAFNAAAPGDAERRGALLRALIPDLGEGVTILSPFYTDYGSNCRIGAGSFLNHGVYLMDGAPITLGRNCFLGPSCGLYTANHPLNAVQRAQGLERALPITLGDDVWLGGNVVILPGVTIGSGSVIGAGSVVTHDIPPGVVAAGNPCRVLRPITEADRVQP